MKQSSSEEDFQLLTSSSFIENNQNQQKPDDEDDVQFDPTPKQQSRSLTSPIRHHEQIASIKKTQKHRKSHSQRRQSIPTKLALKRTKTAHNLNKQAKLRKEKQESEKVTNVGQAEQEQQQQEAGGIIPILENIPLTITGLVQSMSKLLVSNTKPKAPSKQYRKFRFDKEFKIPNKEKKPLARKQQNFSNLSKNSRKM